MKYLCANINYWNAAFWCLYYFKSWFHFILFCFVGKCILSSVQVYTYDEGIVQVEYKERIIATVVVHHHIVGPLFSPCIFARNMFHSVYWSKGEKKMNEIAIINNSCEIDKLQNNFRKVWNFVFNWYLEFLLRWNIFEVYTEIWKLYFRIKFKII